MTSSEDALYAEAERVYRAAVEARWKYELTGDYSEFPPEMAELYAPGYLEAVRASFNSGREVGARLTGGVPVLNIGPLPGVNKDDSDIAIETCYDTRGLIAVDAAGAELSRGQMVHGIYYLKHFDHQLKIFDAELAEVSECVLR